MVTRVITECRSGYKPKKAEQNDDRGTKEKGRVASDTGNTGILLELSCYWKTYTFSPKLSCYWKKYTFSPKYWKIYWKTI